MLLLEYNIHDAVRNDQRGVSGLFIHTETQEEIINRPYLFGAPFMDINPFVFMKVWNKVVSWVFIPTHTSHLKRSWDTVTTLTWNFCVVVQQVLLSLLCSHIIINAEDQILFVMLFLAVAENKDKILTSFLV